jgi:hypothetical protein
MRVNVEVGEEFHGARIDRRTLQAELTGDAQAHDCPVASCNTRAAHLQKARAREALALACAFTNDIGLL